MQPSIKRRTFLQLLGLPALAFVRPRYARSQEAPHYDGLTYTDSEGNTDFSSLHDNNRTTGVEYPA
jgi:hypothetical protein